MFDEFLPEAIDVHRASSNEMQQRALDLRRTDQPARTARNGPAFLAHDVRAALRTGRWQRERQREGFLGEHVLCRRLHRTRFEHDGHDFGDHVAGAAHDHRIADAHILAARLVLVVQRGVGDVDPADEYRLQFGDRGERPGTPDLHVDGDDHGACLLGRVLVRHRPARLAGTKPQAALKVQAVNLVDHAIDVERQLWAQRPHARVKIRQTLPSPDDFPVFANGKPEIR